MNGKREMILNLYKIKQGKEKSKYKKEKRRKCNGKVESSGKIKKQRERGNVGRSITVNVD